MDLSEMNERVVPEIQRVHGVYAIKVCIRIRKASTMSAETSIPATSPFDASSNARDNVLPCPKPTSRTREAGSNSKT
jgi:hypothetical protein